MKLLSFLASVLVIGAFSLFLHGCKKSSDTPANHVLPTVVTNLPANTTASTADISGTVTNDGGSEVTARGFEWYAFFGDTGIHKLPSGAGAGTFTSTLSGLSAHTAYNFRAYATNAVGTVYGDYQSIYTEKGVPSLRTDSVRVEYNLWKSGGYVLSDGGGTITEKGVCWSTHTNPTTADAKAEGIYLSQLTFYDYLKLNTNSTYHIRAYAKNEYGTGYGDEVTCTTGIAIGLYHGGGVIFYLDGTGQHGYIASLANQSNGAQWSSIYITVNANSTTDGATNTTRIINSLGSGSYAAKLCRNYTGGGYTDWYLPALSQLNGMSSSGIIPDFPGYISSLGTKTYWSSTERTNGDAFDNLHYPNNTFSPSFDAKNSLFCVRAIRSF